MTHIPLKRELVEKALRRAYSLGQTYWQQADSESMSQWKKADETADKFTKLVEETCSAISQPDTEQAEAVAWHDDAGQLVGVEPHHAARGALRQHLDADHGVRAL